MQALNFVAKEVDGELDLWLDLLGLVMVVVVMEEAMDRVVVDEEEIEKVGEEGEQCKKKCNFFARNFCLFHDGWLAKLKQDWRFCETEPQGGDEKALSNNSNSHQMTLKSSTVK